MSTKRPRHGTDGSARHSAGRSVPRRDHLRVVDSPNEHAGSSEPQRDETFRRVQQHLQLASRLGVGPLTVAERARSMLAGSCAGWRRNGQCVTHDARPCAQPHEACLLAQYHHDLLLLEHGLLGVVPCRPEAVGELTYSTQPNRKRTSP